MRERRNVVPSFYIIKKENTGHTLILCHKQKVISSPNVSGSELFNFESTNCIMFVNERFSESNLKKVLKVSDFTPF